MGLLIQHWESNKEDKEEEEWEENDAIVNSWESPTYIVNVHDEGPLEEAIWHSSKIILEKWTGMELSPASLCGIRMYTEGKSITWEDSATAAPRMSFPHVSIL